MTPTPDFLPSAVVRCLRADRRPLPVEIEQVAARMWTEIVPGGGPWRDVDHRSVEGRRILRFARSALGLPPMPAEFRKLPEE